jgi:hypothetical protein
MRTGYNSDITASRICANAMSMYFNQPIKLVLSESKDSILLITKPVTGNDSVISLNKPEGKVVPVLN